MSIENEDVSKTTTRPATEEEEYEVLSPLVCRIFLRLTQQYHVYLEMLQ